MSTLRLLRNLWVLWVTTMVLVCLSDAVAQVSYRVTDLGDLGDGNLGCAMGLNDRGWTEIMYGTEIDPLQVGPFVKGGRG
jgi:hypothetical protein